MILINEEQLTEKLKQGGKLSYSERRRFDAFMETKFQPTIQAIRNKQAKGEPFHEVSWREGKVKEYLRTILPMRPYEKQRPKSERTPASF